MAKLDLFFPTLIRNEGGFVNHPSDPGGATNWGIILTNWIKWGRDLDGDGDIDVEDLKKMSQADAYQIYKKQFWDKIMADQITSQDVANIFFDMYVNAPGVAVKMMQRALALYFGQSVTVDGVVGPATIKAINGANAGQLHDAYKRLRASYYRYRAGEVDANDHWHLFFKSQGYKSLPEMKVFLKGWLNRVNHFVDLLKKKISDGSSLALLLSVPC